MIIMKCTSKLDKARLALVAYLWWIGSFVCIVHVHALAPASAQLVQVCVRGRHRRPLARTVRQGGSFRNAKVAHAATCELSALEKPVIAPYNRGRPPTKRFPDPRDVAARAWACDEIRKFREAALGTISA